MSFGRMDRTPGSAPMGEINMTPLIDVMLVLLVIFIITAPLFTHAIKLELPNAQSQAAPEKPETITLAINGEGKLFWNNAAITREELATRITTAAEKKPQPELQLRADKSTRYEVIAQVMAAAQTGGMTKIGFVTDPQGK